jgi:hypothetical protein
LRLSRPELDSSLLPDASPESYDALLAKIAKAIVEREMTVPAIMLIESVKPLSFLGNQLLIFLNPIVSLVISSKDYYTFVRMIEDRDNVEKLLVAIEEENARVDAARKVEKAARPRRRSLFPLFRHR